MKEIRNEQYLTFLAVEMCDGNKESRNKLIEIFKLNIDEFIEKNYDIAEDEKAELKQDAILFTIELLDRIKEVGTKSIPENFKTHIEIETIQRIEKAYKSILETGIISFEQGENQNPTLVSLESDEVGMVDDNFEHMIERNSFLFTLVSLEPLERRIFLLLMRNVPRAEIAICADLSDKELDEFIASIQEKTSKNYLDEFVIKPKDKQKSLNF